MKLLNNTYSIPVHKIPAIYEWLSPGEMKLKANKNNAIWQIDERMNDIIIILKFGIKPTSFPTCRTMLFIVEKFALGPAFVEIVEIIWDETFRFLQFIIKYSYT